MRETERITLSDTGLSKQMASWDFTRFGLIDKQGGLVKVILQTPEEAKAYADFVYQRLEIPLVSFGEKKQRPPLIITDADWHKENPDQQEAVY